MYEPTPQQLRKIRTISAWKARPPGTFAALGLRLPDLIKLEKALSGEVVFPWDPEYPEARRSYNPAWLGFPPFIIFCESFRDVRLSLRFIESQNLSFVVRSSGHSFASYSASSGEGNPPVINVSRLSYIAVDADKKRAVVGAGTPYGKILTALDDYHLNVPSPNFPTVATAGFMQGGGYGMTSRQLGMASDNVLSFKMMLADGGVVKATKDQNSDLFWAVRGGTGNNFGVLLEVEYQLYAVSLMWGFRIQWEFEHAPEAMLTLQNLYTLDAPVQLGYLAGYGTVIPEDGAEPRPVGIIAGLYNGPREAGLELIQPLLKIPSAELQFDQVGTYEQLYLAILSNPYPVPDVPPDSPFKSADRYLSEPADLSFYQGLADYFLTAQSTGDFIVLEPLGGKINEIPISSSAFIHRNSRLHIWSSAYWFHEEGRGPATAWLHGFLELIDPFVEDQAYQNYPNRDEKRFATLYWGEILQKLQQVKLKYDPKNRFHFQQSIPLPSSENAIEIEEPIQYEWYSSPAEYDPPAGTSQ